MARTCVCGGKTIHAKKVTPKKVTPKKVAPNHSGHKSAASVKATKIATKKALAQPNPFAKGCKCS